MVEVTSKPLTRLDLLALWLLAKWNWLCLTFLSPPLEKGLDPTPYPKSSQGWPTTRYIGIVVQKIQFQWIPTATSSFLLYLFVVRVRTTWSKTIPRHIFARKLFSQKICFLANLDSASKAGNRFLPPPPMANLNFSKFGLVTVFTVFNVWSMTEPPILVQYKWYRMINRKMV